MPRLDWLVRLFQTSSGTSGGLVDDRRASVRFACPGAQATCQYFRRHRGSSWWTCQIADLSESGVGLIHDRPLPVGTLITLELAHPERSFLRRTIARVVHATPTADTFVMGVAFVQPLTPEEVGCLIP